MNPDVTNSDHVVPEPLRWFEAEWLQASDPDAVLDRYCREFPELAERLTKIASGMAMLRATRKTLTSTKEPPLPERFGPYKVIKEHDRGGMGVVYEAVEDRIDRRVAIKAMRRRESKGPLRRRFENEQRALARLHHTNVVPIYFTGSEGDSLYFAMPYLSGASLSGVIQTACARESTTNDLTSSTFEELLQTAFRQSEFRETNREPEGRPAGSPAHEPRSWVVRRGRPQFSNEYIRSVVQVMVTVARATHHAHQEGVVHRDLTPRNIFVELDGHVWVIDFGLAAMSWGVNSSLPRPGGVTAPFHAPETDADLGDSVIGTSGYIPKERLLSPGEVDARSDIWSLGVILFELLTLQRAYRDNEAVRKNELADPGKDSPSLDPGLEAVILKAIKPGPEDRYQSAMALADDLDHWLRGEPVSVWPSHRIAQPLWRLWLWSKRNKGWAAALALALTGFLSLSVFAEAQRRNAVEREEARVRQIQLLNLQRETRGEHKQDWSRAVLDRVREIGVHPEEKDVLQGLAVEALTGLDTHLEKEMHLYARAVAFAPDGRLWLGDTGGGAKRWSPETGVLETWPRELSGPLGVRADGAVWQVGPTFTERDRPDRFPVDPRPGASFPLQLLDVESQEGVREFADPIQGGSRLLAWTISPQGSHVAATVLDREGQQAIVIWDVATGELRHRIACRRSPESPALTSPGLTFAPDASVLASWDGSGHVDLWDVAEGQSITGFTIRQPVAALAFGKNHWLRDALRTPADRWMLAVGDANAYVTLWNPGIQSSWQVLHLGGHDVFSLAFSPDGTFLASAGRTQGIVWDVATGQPLVRFATGDYTTALAFSPDGTRLVSSYYSVHAPEGAKARTLVFRLEPGRGIRHLHGLPGGVAKTLFSQDGQRVAAISWDWWAGVWDRKTGRLIRLMAVPRGQFVDNASFAFSPNGRSLATSGGNIAMLWDLEKGEDRRFPQLPWALTESLAFVGNDRLMLFRTEVKDGSRSPDSGAPAAEYPRVCVLRNLLGPKPEEPMKVIGDFPWFVQEIAAAPDGSCFVIEGIPGMPERSATRSMRVYDPNGEFLSELPAHWPAKESGQSWFDPSGRLMIVSLGDSRVYQLFEMPTGRFLGPAPCPVRGIAPGARLFSQISGETSQLSLYDRSGKLLVGHLADNPHQHKVPFSPDLDGRYLLWGNPSGLVSLADLVKLQSHLTEVGLGW